MKRNIYILFTIGLFIRILPSHSVNLNTERLSNLKRLVENNIAYDSIAPIDSVIAWGQQLSPILEKENKMELSFSIRQLVVYIYSLDNVSVQIKQHLGIGGIPLSFPSRGDQEFHMGPVQMWRYLNRCPVPPVAVQTRPWFFYGTVLPIQGAAPGTAFFLSFHPLITADRNPHRPAKPVQILRQTLHPLQFK